MCGIAGYFGKKNISEQIIKNTLGIMKNRGPDFSNYLQFNFKNKLNLYFLHSRLSIIDLNKRSNQPFKIGNDVIIFNGEIYNYIELKEKLIKKKIKLYTSSDTEILLQYYKLYGEDCLSFFEGMWSFAIFNLNSKKLFLARDRFAEKPLYFLKENDGCFFGSETKFIKKLKNEKIEINKKKLNTYLSFGYKSIIKDRESYFKDVYSLLGSEKITIDEKLDFSLKKYWKPKIQEDYKINTLSAVKKIKETLTKSLTLRMRADVSSAFLLSGGVDSGGIASIASKEMNYKIDTFSIIDKDERYNEKDNIESVVSDIKSNHSFIYLDKKNFLERITNLVDYHDGPVLTLSQYLHSLLLKSISATKNKVVISGTGADEMFTGYLDHFLLHLNEIHKSEDFKENLLNWKEYISINIRDKKINNPNLYIENNNYREHIYDNYLALRKYLLNAEKDEFKEFNYSKKLFSNRRLNELFNEITPPILNNEDLNSMHYSIENRSPYLDTNLFNLCFSIPANLLIQKGYGKYLLRESLKGILIDKVRLDRQKKGFNCSIDTLIDFDKKDIRDYLLTNSPIFNYIKKEEIEKLLNSKHKPNFISKFLFSFITSKIFLENNE